MPITVTVTDSQPYLMVRWRLDQGGWTDYQYLDLGSKGDRDPWIDIRSLGIGREIEIEIIESEAVNFILTDAIIKYKRLMR